MTIVTEEQTVDAWLPVVPVDHSHATDAFDPFRPHQRSAARHLDHDDHRDSNRDNFVVEANLSKAARRSGIPRPFYWELRFVKVNCGPFRTQVWLGECYEWMVGDEQISPHDTQKLTRALESALLDSDLKDSMQPGTGFPEGVTSANNLSIQGSILVQIVDITEIGHSAFSLTNIRQTRLDQEDLAGLTRQNEEENENENQADEDAGPIPKYPRSMLKLHLSDGSVTVPAIEFKKIPELELGVTVLGCKVIVYFVRFLCILTVLFHAYVLCGH